MSIEGSEVTCHVSEIRAVNKPQPLPGILLSTVPLYDKPRAKITKRSFKKLTLCSLGFSLELISLLTHRLQDCTSLQQFRCMRQANDRPNTGLT